MTEPWTPGGSTLAKWTRDDLDANCRVLGCIPETTDEYAYSHFVYVPYGSYRTLGEPMQAYITAKAGRVAVFLVRVDTWDVRHVVIGFKSDVDRQAFIDTDGKEIVVPRRPVSRS